MVKRTKKLRSKINEKEIVELLNTSLTKKPEKIADKNPEKKEAEKEETPKQVELENNLSQSSFSKIPIDSPAPMVLKPITKEENLETMTADAPIKTPEIAPISQSYTNFKDYNLSYSARTYETMDNQLMNKDIEKRSLGMTLAPSSDSQARPINQRIWQEQSMGSQWDSMKTRTNEEKEYLLFKKPKKEKGLFEF